MQRNFDHNDFNSCVHRGLFLLRNLKESIEEDGGKFIYKLETCAWAIEQKIINRQSNHSMMSAVIEFVEGIECGNELYNNNC